MTERYKLAPNPPRLGGAARRRDGWWLLTVSAIVTSTSRRADRSGVSVRYAADVDEQLSGADIALISGMTIGNNSLWDILRAAREHGVKTVCWAVTASNIAP